MATPPKKSLGRGLGSLIGGGVVKPTAPAPAPITSAVAPGLQLQELLLTSIVPNPRQPRRDFDDAQVKELADFEWRDKIREMLQLHESRRCLLQ